MSRAGDVDTGAVAAAVTAERVALADLLDQLEPGEWQTPSLCPGWTMHHVVAHLSLATLESKRSLLIGAIKARGNFNRMIRDMAIERAGQFEPAALIGQIRDTATSTRRAPMSSPLDPLVDILVHGQDIARPLGRIHPMNPDHVVPALAYAIDSRWYGGAKRFIGVKLLATDTPWTWGDGDSVVSGTAGDLLLMATGRAQSMATLDESGAAALSTRPTDTRGTA